MGKLMAVLALLVAVMVLVVERGGANETADAEDVAEQDSFAALCGEYGREAERIVEARNPTPKPELGPVLLAEDGGYTGIPLYAGVPVPRIRWFCENDELLVELRGSWLLGAHDSTSALQNLLADFEDNGLGARRDGLEVVLGTAYEGGMARFDPRAERSRAISAE